MDLRKYHLKKWMLLIAFGVVLFWLLQNLYHLPDIVGYLVAITFPVLLGLALAFILNVFLIQVEWRFFSPLNRRCRKIWPRIRRPISILVTMLLLLGLITMVVLIIIPELVRTITTLSNNVPAFFNELQLRFARLSERYPSLQEYLKNMSLDWSSLSSMLEKYGKQVASVLLNSTITVTTSIFHGAVTTILSIVIAINILAQKEKLRRQINRMLYAYVPRHTASRIIRVAELTFKTFTNFIAGQLTEACILATLCFIGMQIFRFPYSPLISVLVACMALIPIIGTFFSVCIGALLILTVNPIQAFWFIVYFVVLQQIEGNLIYPRVVGSKIGLPALWVLVAVSIGGNAMGVAGMLLNIPLCSVIYVLLREDIGKRMRGRRQGGVPPADETPEEQRTGSRMAAAASAPPSGEDGKSGG